MDLIAYINENYKDKNETLEDDDVSGDDGGQGLIHLVPLEIKNNSLNYEIIKELEQKTSEINLQHSIKSVVTNIPVSEGSESGVGCCLLGKQTRKPIIVKNVKVKMSGLRSSSFCPDFGKLNKEAIASNVVITFDCKMNWKIGFKKLTGCGKMSLKYDFIKYKSTRSEKCLDWSANFAFSRFEN